MLCDPTFKEETLRLALPRASTLTVSRLVVPSVKVTVPVGVAAPLCPDTVAVKLTAWPKVLGLGDPASVVVLAPFVTVCEKVPDEFEKLVSPA